MNSKKILVVEDEDKISEVIAAYLLKEGYTVNVARDGRQALEYFEQMQPDMVILDLMLPYLSGEEVCAQIRKTAKTPIIMLTAKSLEDDKISGLLGGADDYMTKPFSPRELMARVTALLRRSTVEEPPTNKMSFNKGDLQIDLDAYNVTKKNNTVNLTQSELKLLLALANRPQRAFTREELIDIAFEMDSEIYDRTIDSHIKNLRAKIEDNSAKPDYIATIRGIGYKFCGIKDE